MQTRFMPLFLGIDGGGTSCKARLSDVEGKILSTAKSGSANSRLGVDTVLQAIKNSALDALAQAGFSAEMLSAVHAGIGLAGIRRDHTRKQQIMNNLPFASFVLETDASIACLGAHNGQDGAIVICGTGSCGCWYQNGAEHQIGGWGFSLGDQGSGAILGRRLLRETLLAYDGLADQTPLSYAVLNHFSNEPDQLLNWSENAKPTDYGAFTKLVFHWAEKEDPLAERLLKKTAGELSFLIRTLIHKKGVPSVALLGGLSEPILPWLSEDIIPFLKKPQGDALEGALYLIRSYYKNNAQASHI